MEPLFPLRLVLLFYSVFDIETEGYRLTLKAPITTEADDKLCNTFPNLRKKIGIIFHENRLPADDSPEISCLICFV